MTAAVVGVILNLALVFGAAVIWPHGFAGGVDWFAAALGAAAFVALYRFKAGRALGRPRRRPARPRTRLPPLKYRSEPPAVAGGLPSEGLTIEKSHAVINQQAVGETPTRYRGRF